MPAQNNSVNFNQIVELLTPSAISSVLCVIISVAISLGSIFINRYNSSSLKLQYQYYQTHRTLSSSHLGGSILNNSIVKQLPLIGFWAIVGVVVYLIATDIVRAVKSAIELREELDYVHVHRNLLIRNIVIQFAIRIAVIIVALPYLSYFFHRILPYVAQLAISANTASGALVVALYIIAAVFIGSITLHINLILLRLLFLKARLFTYSIGE